jgi:Tfp pilus assembly protein PilF
MGVLLLTALLLAAAPAQTDLIAESVDALQKGDFTTAETKLHAELKTHTQNADALGVLGVVLDQQKKYSEADTVYRRAVALTPRSPALLNNYGNHLVAAGSFRAQFRGEAFNLFNYAQYNLSPFNSFPLCVSCGDFGDLNSTENMPRILQFSLKILF